MRKVLFLFLLSCLIASLLVSAALPVILSDQGTDVRISSTGELLQSGNLTIRIYDAPSEGNLVYEQNFTDAIINGSWNVILDNSLLLDFNKIYYKDYIINDDNLDFNGQDRLAFMSPLGEMNINSNITLGQKISFFLGGIIENIADGWLRLVGNVNVTENLVVGGNVSILGTSLIVNNTQVCLGDGTNCQSSGEGKTNLSQFINDLGFVNSSVWWSGINSVSNILGSLINNDLSWLNFTQISQNFYNKTETYTKQEVDNNLSYYLLASDSQSLNDILMILSVNKTGNIMSLGFYNKSEIDNLLLTSGNSSFSQSLTDNLYYPITNPSNFINGTTGQFLNDTLLILEINSTIWNELNDKLDKTDQGYNETLLINLVNLTLWDYINTSPLSNSSFNQTLTDGLYIAQEDEANMNVNSTTWWASLTGWISGWFVKDGNNLAFNETKLNESMDLRVVGKLDIDDQRYNETTYINQIVSDNNASWTSTYNATYAIWAYNQTTGTYSLYGLFWYNHTSATYNLWNDIWSSTYNSTYDALNSTYGKWWYNMTIPANTYTDTKTSTANLHLHSILNITGIEDNACSGTDKVSNVTFNNGNLQIICSADQTSAGGRTFVKLNADVGTTSNTVFNQTILSLSVSANANYTFACDLWQTGAATTTGAQYNVTSPASPTYFSVSFQNPTSATAARYDACSGTARECTSLGTAQLTTPLQTTIKGRLINGANAGNIIVALRSEVAGSLVTVKRESYCYMETEA